MLITIALLWATVSDLKTRTIPNIASLLLLTAGILNLFAIGLTVHNVMYAILGAFLGGFPMLILAVFKGTIGGGDVKLASSSGFVLGWLFSYLVLMAALFMFVLYGCLIWPKKEKVKAPRLPFAPFYVVAVFVAFTLSILLRSPLVPMPILYL